jgi:RND family efflux transporter MFP subunit
MTYAAQTYAARSALCLLLLIPAARAEEIVRPVRVQTVVFAPREQAVTYAGTVQARVQANLGFRVAGKVTERLAEIGQRVAAGQILARLDRTDAVLSAESAEQAVRSAEAEAVNARAEFQRYQRLGRSSPAYIASEFDRRKAASDGAEARLAQAQRQFALARDQLSYTELAAGAEGVVTGLALEPGQVVAAGQTVLTLAHTRETEIAADVPENRLDSVRNAGSVTVTLWSRPGQTLQGRVREIGALADPASRTFAVKVSVPQTDDLSLGMTASVRFARAAGAPVAMLPASAVVSTGGVPSVWVLEPGARRAAAHKIEVAAWTGDGEVAVAAGVAPGDQVVTAGASLLDAATPVTPWAGAAR